MTTRWTFLSAAMLAAAAAACTTARPIGDGSDPAAAASAAGADAHAEQAQAAAAQGARQRTGYTPADVQFMQHMIGHHAQALVMSALAPDRTARPEIHLLAERIAVSQRDEIAQMQRWLRQRGEPVPPDDAHVHAAMGHGALMPGMLTQQQLDALAAARDVAFDRMFLELMIRHHEGALTMVEQLVASPGAAQEPEIFRFATDVDADQRAEIARMRRLLDTLRDG